jgi:glucoamylase
MAWRLWEADALEEFDPYPMVHAAAAYLILHGPITEQERWEENSGYSPSTLAVTIAGLLCAAAFARDRNDGSAARFLEEYADFLESHVDRWTVTTQGSLLPGITRHYIRIDPERIENRTPNEDPNTGTLVVRNRPPRSQYEFPAREIVDAGFLELVRYGIRRHDDPLIEDSLRVVDAVLKVQTPNGPCWRRYNHDGYGQRPDGGPFEGWGKGRAWPLLTGERGHYEVACGRDPTKYIEAMERFASGSGMLPEQVWDEPDLPAAKMRFGEPTGSAMPLMWAHAEYVTLLRSRADRRVFDAIPIVADRYLASHGRKDLEIWKHIRQVGQVTTGQTLRVQASEQFRLHWSSDEWRTVQDTDAMTTSLGIANTDIPIPRTQKAPIRFTFYWPKAGRWEGQDYTVRVERCHECE